MRQSIPHATWTILKDMPNVQVLQDSGETSFVWLDDEGNLVLQKLNPMYPSHQPLWVMREYTDSWNLKEN